MKWPYPTGTKVKMTKEGLQKYEEGLTNPVNTPGKVCGYDGEVWLDVSWDNGYSNSYEVGTIYPVEINLENK